MSKPTFIDTTSSMDEHRGRLTAASVAILIVLGLGTFGYYFLGGGQWKLFDCFYMTVIAMTTVGFSETLPGFAEVEYVRHFTIALIVLGVGTFLYFVSTLTAIIIEGDLQRALKETRMHKSIDKLRNHIVVCGIGSTGRHVIAELAEYRIPSVWIDRDPEAIAHLKGEYSNPMYLVGDATDDAVLAQANIEHARGVICALADDKDNLYLTISARAANSKLRIVARGSDLRVLDKLRAAGADTVVSPNYIGGQRMASELIRPKVVRFLEDMRKDPSRTRIEELDIQGDSRLVGKNLRQIDLRGRSDTLVLAVRHGEEGGYTFAPSADFIVKAGMTLVVLAPIEDVQRLRHGG